jgi:hypothetical protein
MLLLVGDQYAAAVTYRICKPVPRDVREHVLALNAAG